LLRTRPVNRWWRILVAVAAVPLVVFVTQPLFIDADLAGDASRITGYRSYVGDWGWAGLVRLHYDGRILGYSGDAAGVQRLGVFLTVIALSLAVWWWRRADPAILMLVVFFTFLSVTAGFGVQYLMFPLPLAIAFANRRTWWFVASAALFAAGFYLGPLTAVSLVNLSLFVIAAMLFALPSLPREPRSTPSRVLPTTAVV
jgi:hypothetical protein